MTRSKARPAVGEAGRAAGDGGGDSWPGAARRRIGRAGQPQHVRLMHAGTQRGRGQDRTASTGRPVGQACPVGRHEGWCRQGQCGEGQWPEEGIGRVKPSRGTNRSCAEPASAGGAAGRRYGRHL